MKKLLFIFIVFVSSFSFGQTQIVPRQIVFSGQNGVFLKKTDWDILKAERNNLQAEIAALKGQPAVKTQDTQTLMCKIDNLSCQKELEFLKRTLNASLNNIQDSNMRETLRAIINFNETPKQE